MKWFLSSSGTNDLALTIKALLVSLIPLVIAFGQSKGWDITENQVMEVIEAGFAAVAGFMLFVGLVRKLVNRVR